MAKYEFETTDTKKFTLTIFLAFVLIFVIFLAVTTCQGNKIPPAEKNYPGVPASY